ncbi:MAG: hypothetical protein R3F56_20965 [Planctomycetota bacterium]
MSISRSLPALVTVVLAGCAADTAKDSQTNPTSPAPSVPAAQGTVADLSLGKVA